MKVLVVTTLNKKLYEAYGSRFFETYNWPFDLLVYSEDMVNIPNTNIIVRNIYEEVPECKEFVNRNKHKQPISQFDIKSNDFITDGVRFCYKVYSYTHLLINNKDYDGVIGIDADSIFYNSINEEWIKKNIYRDECMMTYLGRGNNYSECGFLYWNMNHPQTKAYAKFMKDLYDTDYIYKLKEQHDSFIWDYARVRFEDEFGIVNHNIGDGKTGHVQARSVLGEIYDHTKGPRKLKGRSDEARIK
jgi:hypothetical protein